MEVFGLADKYALEPLKMLCEQALLAALSVDNAWTTLTFFDLHSVSSKAAVLRFVARNIHKVVATEGFKQDNNADDIRSTHLLSEVFDAMAAISALAAVDVMDLTQMRRPKIEELTLSEFMWWIVLLFFFFTAIYFWANWAWCWIFS